MKQTLQEQTPRTFGNMNQTALDALECAVWFLDKDLNLVGYNHVFESYFLRAAGFLPRIDVSILKQANGFMGINEIESLNRRAQQTKVSFQYSFMNSLWRVSLQSIQDDHHDVLIMGQCTEIPKTEGHANELSLLLSGVPEVVMYKESAGSISISENIYLLLGYHPYQLEAPRYFRNLVHPIDRERVFESIARWKSKKEPGRLSLEYRLRMAGGDYVTVEDSMLMFQREEGFTSISGILHDVSQRSKTLDALSEHEDIFNSFMSNIPALAWIKDQKQDYLFMNKAFENVKGQLFIEQKDFYSEAESTAFSKQELSVHESIFNIPIPEAEGLPENKSRCLQVYTFPIKRSEKDPLIGGVAFDITKQKSIEQALRMSEERFRMISYSSRDIISVHDKEGRFTYASPSLYTLTGYEQTDVTELRLFEFIHEADLPVVLKKFHQAVSGDDDCRLEYRMRKKDGAFIWVETLPTFNLDESGQLIGFHANTREVSDRKFAETKLEEQYALTRDILDILPGAICIKDEERRVLFCNDGFSKLMGFPADQLIGKKVQEIVPLAGKVAEMEARDQAVLESLKESHEGEILTLPDGSVRHFFTVRKVLILPNSTRRLLVTFSDVTSLAEAEKKLQDANEELKTFVFKASHDLKGPLSSILGLTNLARTTTDDQRALHLFGFIGDRTTKLTNLLDELLRIAQVIQGSIDIMAVDFTELTNSIVSEHQHNAEFEKLIIHLEDLSDRPLFTNLTLVNSIFQNLIENAVKYSRRDLSPEMIIRIENDAEEFTIRFIDNGIGIRKEDQPKVFNMFYRASTEEEGSGLGLYIVKKSVEKLRGTIELNSTENQGTTFILKIPSNQQIK